MKGKIIIIAIIWTVYSPISGNTIELGDLGKPHADAALVAGATDVTPKQASQQIKDNFEKAAIQFGLVREAIDCGAVSELNKLIGDSNKRLNLDEVMALERVDVYKAILLNLDRNFTLNEVKKLKDSKAITLSVRSLGQELVISNDGDPCDSKQSILKPGDRHGSIIDTCTAFNLLLAALENKYVFVRVEAARAIGKIEHSRVIEPLIASLRDESNDVRKVAAEALVKITGNDLGRDPEKWEKWWETKKQAE